MDTKSNKCNTSDAEEADCNNYSNKKKKKKKKRKKKKKKKRKTMMTIAKQGGVRLLSYSIKQRPGPEPTKKNRQGRVRTVLLFL